MFSGNITDILDGRLYFRTASNWKFIFYRSEVFASFGEYLRTGRLQSLTLITVCKWIVTLPWLNMMQAKYQACKIKEKLSGWEETSRDTQEVNVDATSTTVTRVSPGLSHPIMIKLKYKFLRTTACRGRGVKSARGNNPGKNQARGYNQPLSKLY